MAAVNANTQIYDKSVDRAAMIRLYERRINGKTELIINGHAVRVDKLIRNAELSGKGFETFREAVDQEILRTMNDGFETSKRSLLDFAKDQMSFSVQNIDGAIGNIWRTAYPPRQIAEEIVLKKPLYNNVTLEQGWANLGIAERKRLEATIRKGIADGLDSDAIAKLVRAGSDFKITNTQAQGLTITALTSVYAQTDHEVYKANEKALLGWQYIAVLDSRTTAICRHRSGTIYPVGDTAHLPPAHWHCRSTTIPVTKSWDDLSKLEGVGQIRKNNLRGLSPKQIQFFDGQQPQAETYSEWLQRQPAEVQLRHLGDINKVELFRSGQLTVNQFSNDKGNEIGIRQLRQLTDPGFTTPGDTQRFAIAKEKLDTLKLGASRPEDFYNDPALVKALSDYYKLQTKELDGTLSLTNYRGVTLGAKKATKTRVLATPPSEDSLKFNPITGRYEDARLYQPTPSVLANNLRLIDESTILKAKDKDFIKKFVESLNETMSVNEQAAIADNLRIIFGRYRNNGELWTNFKAVTNSQIQFDVMNVSDFIETQLRKDSNLLSKLAQGNYIDPVLGPVQLQDLHDQFIDNILTRNKWEDKVAPKIAKELRNVFDYKIPYKLRSRIDEEDLKAFYLKFANRLSLADCPDRDQLAVSLGRDLYNMANYRGSRYEWWNLGVKILDNAKAKGFYTLDTYGTQKRRMKSRLGYSYFGPYYDTNSVFLRITDPRIQEYSRLQRSIDVGLRVGVTVDKNRLIIREGYKTYFIDNGVLGYLDTRIPITSTDSFSTFPAELVDKNLTDALNWASNTKYKIDPQFHDFVKNLLYFQDDKGSAKYYNDLNVYREFIVGRGDSYERFKAMEWLRNKDVSFSNHPFLDHRGRIYDRGLISPQSGEAFRPFLNTAHSADLGVDGFNNLQDQIGSFLGGLSDKLEGRSNSLSIVGRQQIAEKWRKDLVSIGNNILRNKPNDIRKVLESDFVQSVDGEEQGKLFRYAMEMAKIDEYLGGNYSAKNLLKLNDYKINLALEQDASSSGAQIIALTTKNKQLAELSNVIPTNQKQRLYDEIASLTYNDPRFKQLNEKLGLTEKDLRKAAKAQNMVTLYGAGERTGIMNVESKLAKALDKGDNILVVRASERDQVLNEISARMARYEKIDPEMYQELKALRQDVKDIFNKGTTVGHDIMEQLWFLEPKTQDLVEKLSRQYNNIVTPDDFKAIAQIMSEHLREQVPILKDFTRYFGRLAEDFVLNAKPSDSSFDISHYIRTSLLGERNKKIPDYMKRVPGFVPTGNLAEILYGVQDKNIPKSWTWVPWVNFDGKIIEQHFTQSFEERLLYRDKNGEWVTNIVQVAQKTDPTWWDQFTNKSGKINDIVDAGKARTAFAVNGNHSNDATLVKNFHLWGKSKQIPTSTIHDAFFTNAGEMLQARKALRDIYASAVNNSSIQDTLDEMYRRGMPRDLYLKYVNEAIDIGLLPKPGRSVIGGKVITADDVLTDKDILEAIPESFKENRYWYGVG